MLSWITNLWAARRSTEDEFFAKERRRIATRLTEARIGGVLDSDVIFWGLIQAAPVGDVLAIESSQEVSVEETLPPQVEVEEEVPVVEDKKIKRRRAAL